ncbi:MAG: BNR repeat-containing protein [Sedimentisphaerales bacterium]|nr:BNR repeat-containing protein [Sedimentisphaerales bacterium]
MKKAIGKLSFIIPFLLLAGVSARAEIRVDKVLEVESVWAGHPVGFCLLTDGGYQYVVYYDADRNMRIAMRKLDQDTWTYTTLPSSTGWDSHNYIRMALDRKGYLHLSGNMHCVPLIYFRSQRPYDATTLQRIPSMVGTEEKRCTYPQFIKGARGEMIFRYRDGGSGNGNEIFNVYDESTRTWRRLLDKPLTDGRGQMNAYIRGPVKGPDGYFHISWVWRNTPDCSTNHDLSYARSRDLVHWQTAGGEPLDLPITIDTLGVIVDPIPVQGGVINGNGAIGFDGDNRVTLSYHKFDKNGKTQAYCARWQDDGWNIVTVSDWDYRWYFSGGGSIHSEIGLGAVETESDGSLTLSWRHVKYGSSIWKLNPETLTVVGVSKKEPQIPRLLGKVESDFLGMQVRWANDLGENSEPGVRYMLRWETLDRNRDRPRSDPLPKPSTLRLYKLRDY